MIRIDGEGKIEFRMDEIAEELGREMTPQLFEIALWRATRPPAKWPWPCKATGSRWVHRLVGAKLA